MRAPRSEFWAGRVLLLALMAFTILPFISIFVTALHPSGTVPSGLEWPADPQWGNFIEAFNVANMTALPTPHAIPTQLNEPMSPARSSDTSTTPTNVATSAIRISLAGRLRVVNAIHATTTAGPVYWRTRATATSSRWLAACRSERASAGTSASVCPTATSKNSAASRVPRRP